MTIVPGQHPGNPSVDPARTLPWSPNRPVERKYESAPSAFPEARRFETIYPGSAASEEASAQMRRAREHDRTALDGFTELVSIDADDAD